MVDRNPYENGNLIKVKKLEKQFKRGPAKCPEAAVSSLAVWPEKTNFLAYPPFKDVVKLNQFFDVIEIQMQCPKDFYGNKKIIREAVELCREKGLEVTLHFPFMDIERTATGYRVYQMPLVIPTAIHTIPKRYNVGYDIEFAIKEMNADIIRDVINFGSEMEIKQATLHISVPSSRFTPVELERYISIVGPLADYAKSKNLSISIETGGATLEEIIKISKLPVTFTNDIVHATIDGINVIDLCKELGHRIDKLHLSESPFGKDAHQQLTENGNYTNITRQVFAEIIKMITEAKIKGYTYSPLVIFESQVSPEAINGENKEEANVKVFSYITDDLIKKQKVLLITHGLTRSGKSTILRSIIASLSDSNLNINIINTDIERPIEQHRCTLEGKFVSQEERGMVYDNILKKVDECYKEGADVVAVDGTFSQRKWRKKFIDYAKQNNYSLFIIKSECPDWETIKKRLAKRDVENVLIPISVETYRKLVDEFQPLNPLEVKGTNSTIIHYNSYNNTLRVEAGEKPTSKITEAITEILLRYANARNNINNIL